MARGGRREGSGRKAGSVNKRTREIANRAIEEGITPLEVMLGAMRTAWDYAQTLDDGPVKFDHLTAAADLAKDAAPYVHPRLQAVEHTGKDGAPLIPAETNAKDNEIINRFMEAKRGENDEQQRVH